MKKIYLSAVLILVSIIVNAQDKPKTADNNLKVEHVEIRQYGDISIDVKDPGTEMLVGPTVPDDNGIVGMVGLEVQPGYPGGSLKLMEDIHKNIDASDNGAPKGTKLKTYISFIVEKDGTLSDVKCVRDPGYGFGKEGETAIRKLKKKWTPGIQNGKPVRANYSFPLTIKVP